MNWVRVYPARYKQAVDLKDKRQAAGLTQTQAAQRLGLSLRQYQRLEASGKAKPAIVKLAQLVMNEGEV